MVGSDRVFGAFGSIGCRGSAGGLAPFVSKEREHGVPEVQTSRGGGRGRPFPPCYFSCENYQTLHVKQPDVASGLHQTRGIKDNGGSNRRILNKIFAIFHFGAIWTLAHFFAGKMFV